MTQSTHLAQGWLKACAELDLPSDFVVRQGVALYEPGHRQIIEDILARCRRSGITALIVHSDPDAISVAIPHRAGGRDRR